MTYFVSDAARLRPTMNAYRTIAGGAIATGLLAGLTLPDISSTNGTAVAGNVAGTGLLALTTAALAVHRSQHMKRSAGITASLLGSSLALGISTYVSGDVIHSALTVKPTTGSTEEPVEPTFLPHDVGRAHEDARKLEMKQLIDEYAGLMKRSRSGSPLSSTELQRMTDLQLLIDEDDRLSRVGNEASGQIIDRSSLHNKVSVLGSTRGYDGDSWSVYTGDVRAAATGYSDMNSAVAAARIVGVQRQYGALIVHFDDRYFVTTPSIIGEHGSTAGNNGEVFDSLNLHGRKPESSHVIGIADRHGRATIFSSGE